MPEYNLNGINVQFPYEAYDVIDLYGILGCTLDTLINYKHTGPEILHEMRHTSIA